MNNKNKSSPSTSPDLAQMYLNQWKNLGNFDQPNWPFFNGQPVPLGGMSAEEFIRDYWHKKPLLIRNAIPDFQAFYTPKMALSACGNVEIESRLVQVDEHSKWSLKHGPIKKNQLPKTSASLFWTALVQGVDQHHPLGHALINLFRFIPDARLDDLMISLANQGGGVGPHFDSYDVFLLQAHGQRHWQISSQDDDEFVENLPLRILKNFTTQEDWILEPGDMLYLPPMYAHNGVSVSDECMTYSIGFRAPTFHELGDGLLNFIGDNIDIDGRYADPALQPQKHPAQISEDMIDQITEQLSQLLWDHELVAEFLGCYLTEPKPSTLMGPEGALSINTFSKRINQHGMVLFSATKMLYANAWVFVNGEHVQVDGVEQDILIRLANQRCLSNDDCAQIEGYPALLNFLYALYQQGALCIEEVQ